MGMTTRMSKAALVTALLGAGAIVAACGTSEQRVVFDPDPVEEPPPALSAVDGSMEEASSDAAAGAMCPSDKCKVPFATCSTSKYLCDIDLANDVNNCGSCGNKCPTETWRNDELHAKWICVDGGCQMTCSTPLYADCNGRIEDGCETPLGSLQHCGACGVQCTGDAICFDGSCQGCKAGEVRCNGQCVDLASNDVNCGACGKICTTLAGAPAPPKNMFYGCQNSECGHLKCRSPWVDCNEDIDDGCEVRLDNDTQNCGACGTKCAPGEICVNGTCQCNPGPLGCDCLIDFESDLKNCGACGLRCLDRPNATTTCTFGRCGNTCKIGYGDCNRDQVDGCEVDLMRDPTHCGSCETRCETGQACIDGVCATEPCPPGVFR